MWYKRVTFTFLLQFTKQHVSKASLKHPHILQRTFLFHRHLSEASASQPLQTVAEVHAKQAFFGLSQSLSTKAVKGREVEQIFINSPSTLLGQFSVVKKKEKEMVGSL